MKTQSKRTYRKWGGVYFALFATVLVVILSVLHGFFNAAQWSKNDQPHNTFYEGEDVKMFPSIPLKHQRAKPAR